MLSYSSSFKPKSKGSTQLSAAYLSTYQLQSNRKSFANNNPNLKKEKTYRKVITETNEPDSYLVYNKYTSKPVKPQSKGSSPTVKKNMFVEKTSSNSKLCFSNNVGKIKRVKKPSNVQKAFTQTGPLIQRYQQSDHLKTFLDTAQKDKVYPTYLNDEKHQFSDSKKQNMFIHKESQIKRDLPPKETHLAKRSSDTRLQANIYMKMRMNTEGTNDSTPLSFGPHDIQICQVIGQGTFGKVYRGRLKKTGQIVAIKKVFQDPKYKNRQVQIVSMLKGQYVMKVLGNYSTFEEEGQFLNIIMSYYEGDLYSLIRSQGKRGLSTSDIKVLSYQIWRGLLFIHQVKIAHRDIKPHNILYKGKRVAICDFGSAKIMTSQPNLPYICSRCYRAPELIFGASHYSTMIDVWSVGCVLLQMLQGTPLFIGQSSIDHLIQIIKVLGTPTKSQVIDMNPSYDLNDYKFPKVKKREWNKIFPKADPLLLDLLSQLMIYSPKKRLNAAQALAHEFYDELREQPIGRALNKQLGVNLFSFYPQQLKGHQHLIPKLIPQWSQGLK